MPSPFPGMDPYLEQRDIWPEFHGEFIYALRAELSGRVPEQYVVRVDRHIYVRNPSEEEELMVRRPDSFVADDGDGGAATDESAATATPAPVEVRLPMLVRERSRFLKVVDGEDRRVVTVVEVLSPSNKRSGPDRDAYLEKRSEYLGAGLNFVEIDLLRAGRRMEIGDAPPSTYVVFVSRASDYPKAGLWPIGLREPLPTILVPLDPGVPDASIELQSCLMRVYDQGSYRRQIDYRRPARPTMSPNDAAWAATLMGGR